MPSNGTDPTYGSPVFPETNAPAFGADLTEVARFAGRGGPFVPGSTAERNAATGAAARNGVFWADTTNGELYRRVSGSWSLIPQARTVFGHAGKTGGFQPMAGGQVATIALQDTAGGFTLAANGLVVPVTGRYQVNVRFYYSGAFGGNARCQVQVNGAERVQLQNYKGAGDDMTATATQIMLLSAGDNVRLWSDFTDNTWGTTGYDGTYIEALRVA